MTLKYKDVCPLCFGPIKIIKSYINEYYSEEKVFVHIQRCQDPKCEGYKIQEIRIYDILDYKTTYNSVQDNENKKKEPYRLFGQNIRNAIKIIKSYKKLELNKLKIKLEEIKDFFTYEIPCGVKNLKNFFNVIWQFRGCDYEYNLQIFQKSLKLTADYLERHDPQPEDNDVVVNRIRETVDIIEKMLNNDYYDEDWEKLIKNIGGDENIPGSDLRRWWV